MSDVIHATARAIDMVRRRARFSSPTVAPGVNACDGRAHGVAGLNNFTPMGFSVAMARALVETGAARDADRIPTCPECRRLLDAALDPTFERDRSTDAAWASVAEALKERA